MKLAVITINSFLTILILISLYELKKNLKSLKTGNSRKKLYIETLEQELNKYFQGKERAA